MNIKDFKVGDKVVVLDTKFKSTFQRADILKECSLVETTVTAVGKKFVTVAWCNAKFGNIKYDGHPMFLSTNIMNKDDLLFKSRDDFEQYIRILDMTAEIRSFCSNYGLDSKLSPEKIQTIYDIIKGSEEDD